MWSMVYGQPGMVAWCLDHGASVIPSDEDWERYGVIQGPRYCDPILDAAAAHGDIATFELLRLKGAPLGQRTLHRAVEVAGFGPKRAEDPEKLSEKQREDRAKHARHMDMVYHLLDVLKLDVNAPDRAPGDTRGMSSAYGTPICYISGSFRPDLETCELTWLLLDRGADPAPALKDAEGHAPFLEDVKAWKSRHSGRGRNCCVQ